MKISRMPVWNVAFWICACCAAIGVIVSLGMDNVRAQTPTPTPTARPSPTPSPTPVTVIGGISLFSTVSIPLQPVVQPIANLCRGIVVESEDDEWQLSHSSIALGTLSSDFPALDFLQRTLIIERCSGESSLPPIPRIREFSLDPLPSIVDSPRIVSPIITERRVDPRLVNPEAIVAEVDSTPRVDVPIEAVEAILRGIELVPIEEAIDFPEWQPAPQEVLILEGPDGFSVELEPGFQPNTWSYPFPLDSASGQYTVTIRSNGSTIVKPISVLRQERVVVRDRQSKQLTSDFSSPQEVEIEYIDFLSDQPILVALYRVIAVDPFAADDAGGEEPLVPFQTGQTLAPVATWTVPASQLRSQSLVDEAFFPADSIVAGNYVLLVCYVERCDPAPVIDMTTVQDVREVRWPDIFYATFSIESEPLAINTLTSPTLQMQLVAQDQAFANVPVTERLSIRALARDEAVGQGDGDGIDRVDFLLFDSSGILVYAQRENSAAYCVFGGSTPCQPWQFAANEYQWPGGAPIRSGWHTVRAVVIADGGESIASEASFLIQLPPLAATVIQTAQNGAQTLVTDNLVFRVEAYDPLVGLFDGAGIAYVELELYGPDGGLIGSRREESAPYCLFSNPNGATSCNAWDFSQNDNQWPYSSSVVNGPHRLRATVVGQGGRTITVEQPIVISSVP